MQFRQFRRLFIAISTGFPLDQWATASQSCLRLTNASIHGDAMHAQIGNAVRFFFVNGGPNIGSNWHIIGTIFDKTYQCHFSNPLVNQETEYVAPGSAAMFELKAKESGTYLLVDHAIFRASNGALGLLRFD